MDQRKNFLSLILLDALEDENESDIYKILERNNTDPSCVPCERGISPLHYSCGMENIRLAVDVIKRFLERGADPNVPSEDDMTPLHVAAIHGRTEIAALLLKYGAKVDAQDSERKTPVHYAMEEDHFEVVQIMRDHIFEKKTKEKQQTSLETSQHHNSLLTKSKFDKSLLKCQATKTPQKQTSTPLAKELEVRGTSVLRGASLNETPTTATTPVNKNLYYNHDVTSPYYINITHRRHKPQPKFPNYQRDDNNSATTNDQDTLNVSTSLSETQIQPVNIFTLTQENLAEFSHHQMPSADRSRLSLIDTWRTKVQRTRARQSILQEYDDINELIDSVMENDHLNFTNIMLRNQTNANDGNEDIDSGACGSASSSLDERIDDVGKHSTIVPMKEKTPIEQLHARSNMSLGKLIQQLAQAHIVDVDPLPMTMPSTSVQHQSSWRYEKPLESSYQTAPELIVTDDKENIKYLNVPTPIYGEYGQQQQQEQRLKEESDIDTSLKMRSPNNRKYILQMTEAYVHTDDENGLVFYETKLLANHGNKVSHERNQQQEEQEQQKSPTGKNAHRKRDGQRELDTTATSHSTNLTLPLDYETDALRAELTTFGEAPGPITKTTKRLYIKRLIKYQRNSALMTELRNQNAAIEQKFSVELNRTLGSLELFERIPDYMKLEAQSSSFFANIENKKNMREGHLKQSFIYMLIDPRLSANLPGECFLLDKIVVWKRFLQSIFYVGKGKSSRPYSHLYDAMKMHSRLQQDNFNSDGQCNGTKKTIRNLDLNSFKSPTTKSSDSKKLNNILDIWRNNQGVVCLNVYHNILPVDAYTREAAIIDALSLGHLTNAKRGDYYGPSKMWTMKEKKYFGIALLYKALQIHLAEGESQLSPSDLI